MLACVYADLANKARARRQKKFSMYADKKATAQFQDSIESAIKKIKSDETLTVEPVLDRDTKGKAGSVDIAETIFPRV